MVTVVGKNSGHVKHCTCRNCASRLEYTQSEVQSYVHRDYGGGSDTVKYIICPRCGKKVEVR